MNGNPENVDRFIPNRSAMDFDFAHFMLTEGRNWKENLVGRSVSSATYQKLLARECGMDRKRIFEFKSKPPVKSFPLADMHPEPEPIKLWRYRYIPRTSERALDAPDLMDDYHLNLLDWGRSNVLSVALGNTVFLWNASDGSTSELETIGEDDGPVTSVSWDPDGRRIAVGLNNSKVELWDSTAKKKLRTLRGGHRSRVGSLAWNEHILTTGGMDGRVINHDLRVRSHIVQNYRGHTQEVCGLKWSPSGRQLASGGDDKMLFIWDTHMAYRNSTTQYLHRLDQHRAAVKALAWCPLEANLLASGGVGGDGCIKFWDTLTGACLNSVDTGSQVCSLLWSETEKELLSSADNQLILWKYPKMIKIVELTGHTSRVLFMAQSPNGCTVASAAADENLRFWNVFRAPKPAPKDLESFSHISRIR